MNITSFYTYVMHLWYIILQWLQNEDGQFGKLISTNILMYAKWTFQDCSQLWKIGFEKCNQIPFRFLIWNQTMQNNSKQEKILATKPWKNKQTSKRWSDGKWQLITFLQNLFNIHHWWSSSMYPHVQLYHWKTVELIIVLPRNNTNKH